MNKNAVFISILLCLLLSCGQTISQEQNQVNNSVSIQNDTVYAIQFDWTKAATLKKNTIDQLKKKEKPNDKIIMDFLNKYAKLVDEFNEIFFKNRNYDALNDLYYTNKKLVLDFENEVETNGFRLIFPEGMLEISQNTDFIKSGIVSLIDPVSMEFITLYCNEFDNRCCDDAAIIISTEELINRIYKWGELSKKVVELEYKNHVEDAFYSNLYLLFYGIENTPSFDWETKKYNSEAIDVMNKYIEKYPASMAAEAFKPFIELLENENFEKTQKVEEYFKKKIRSQ